MAEKTVAYISSNDLPKLREISEAGMGYQILMARLENEQYERSIIVVGAHIIPSTHDQFISVNDLANENSIPGVLTRGVALMSFRAATAPVSLPVGYVPMQGAVPLLGSITLPLPRSFTASSVSRPIIVSQPASWPKVLTLRRIAIDSTPTPVSLSLAGMLCRFRSRHRMSSNMNCRRVRP